jgi:hypothetical protein
VAEALGYAGGVLAIAAGIYLAGELWPGLSTGAVLAFAAVACVILGAGGAAVRSTGDAALRRLRSVLWLLSTVSLAAFTGTLADQVWRFGPESATLVTAAASAAYGAVLWRRTRGVLQHLAVFASLVVLAAAAVDRLAPGLGAWGPGLAIWGLSALWGVAVMRGYLPPVTTGYVAAGIGLLAGAQLTMQVAAGQALAAATVAGLLAAGVLLRQAWLVALGAVGVLLVVPQTATRYLPMSAAAPLAIFVAGVVLVGAAVWLARHRAGRWLSRSGEGGLGWTVPLTVARGELRERLRDVYWIGGGSGAGKSTVARRLAGRHGLRVYATDEAMADHGRRMTPADSPFMAEFAAMNMDERWVSRPPETMLETFGWFRGEGFGLIMEDLLRLPPGVIAEGFRLLPRLVGPLLSDPGRAVWLCPTPGFRRAAFESRGSLLHIAGKTSDPDKALANLLERDRIFTARLREEAMRLGLPVIEVDHAVTEDDLTGRIARAFGLS